jgi:hypothetical protein
MRVNPPVFKRPILPGSGKKPTLFPPEMPVANSRTMN